MLSEPSDEDETKVLGVAPLGGGSAEQVQPLEPGNFLGSRYEILKRLGQGGMGDVYLARDHELGRDVAMKFIRDELVDREEVITRFRREIELASRVTHPNVLRVYDLGLEDNRRFLTMQYVEGKELTDLLELAAETSEPLKIDTVLSLFRQIVAGVASAHEKGLVHRDLKPQNILIDENQQVYLTDFGLSRAKDQSKLTQTGAVVGTPVYMSPEQVKGEAVDSSTDVFALGVILHQMVSGQMPYSGGSIFEIMMRRLSEPLPPLKEVRPEAPRWIQRIIDRATAVDKSLRYPSAVELLEELEMEAPARSMIYEVRRRGWGRRLLYGVGILILAVVGWKWFSREAPPPSPENAAELTRAAFLEKVPRVGVMPILNRTQDAALDWTGEALARLVSDQLAQSRHLQLVSIEKLQSLTREATNPEDTLKVLAAAGIDYAAMGERLGRPEQSTLTIRLINLQTGDTVASQSLSNLDEGSFLGTADQIARKFREGMAVPLEEQVEFYAADFAATNPGAYKAYVRGLGQYEAFDYGPAIESFEAAVQIEPSFAMAHLRLAQVLAETGRTTEAEAALEAAESLEANLDPREKAYLVAEAARLRRDNAQAEKAYTTLLEAFPYEVEARHLLGLLKLEIGNPQGAKQEAERLLSLDENNGAAQSLLGHAALAESPPNYSEAVTAFERYVELNPEEANGYHVLGDTYRRMGEFGLALDRYQKALAADPQFYFSALSMAELEWLTNEASAAKRRWLELSESEEVPPRFRIDAAFALAHVEAGEGRFKSAINRLESQKARLRAEGVREAMALAYQGLWSIEINDLSNARKFIRQSIERAPSAVKTRYHFAEGMLALETGAVDELERAVEQILLAKLPPENPDRTEEKAAGYLRALYDLQTNKPQQALEKLQEVISLGGYHYAGYRVELAQAYSDLGQHNQALGELKQFLEPNPSDFRLDLELDRARARLAEIKIRQQLGDSNAISEQLPKWLSNWADADTEASLLAEAKALASEHD